MIRKRLTPAGMAVLGIPALFVFFLATSPRYTFHGENEAALVVAMKHVTDKAHICTEEEVRKFLEEESRKERKHIRKKAGACGSRERVPLDIVVTMDGKKLLDRRYRPSGFHRDGNTFLYERFNVAAGKHEIKVSMRDSGKEEGGRYDFTLDQTHDFKGRSSVVLDFDPVAKTLKLS